jgi:WD40 repeat protein
LSAVAPVLSADARYLAAGCADGSLRLWEVETAKELLALPGETTPLAFSPDGRYLVAGGSPPGIRLYHAPSGRKKWEVPTLPAPDRVVFRSDGKALIFSHGASVAQLDMETGKVLAQQKMAPEVQGVAFRPDGRVYYSLIKGGRVVASDADSGKAIWEWHGQNGHQGALFLSSEGKFLAVLMNNTPRAYLLDAATGQALGSADLSSAGSNVLPQCGATADGQRLWALGGSVAGAALFDLRTGKALGRIPSVSVDASMSPDGRRVATAQERGTRVLVVDVLSGRQAAECAKLDSVTKPFAWTPDGQYLFAYRSGGGVYLFGIGPWN